MNFNYINYLPDGFLNSKAEDLWKVFDGPTLIDLNFGQSNYIFFSLLLHGNEPAGLQCLQKLFRELGDRWGVNLLILIGNIEAAKHQVRRLNGQKDFNRIWQKDVGPEFDWAQKVKEQVLLKKPIWGLDIHNNTGRNPHYSCINSMDDRLLAMAGLFSEIAVFFETPKETLSMAFYSYFPILTLESGLPGDLAGVDRCKKFVEKLLNSDLESLQLNPALRVYQVYAKMMVAPDIDIYTGESPESESISLIPGFDSYNFQPVAENSLIGYSLCESCPVLVYDSLGNDISQQVVGFENNKIRFLKASVPSMLSSMPNIVKQDCLGYLMLEKSQES